MRHFILVIVFGLCAGLALGAAITPKAEVKQFQILEAISTKALVDGKVVYLTLPKGSVVSVLAENLTDEKGIIKTAVKWDSSE